MRIWSGILHEESDLIVVGSGAVALAAALRAAVLGARVTLLEKSALFGGTAALSGGMLWIPLNHYQQDAGIKDSADDVLRYLRRITGGRRAEALLELLVERGDEMVRFLEAHSPLRFALVPNFPDYRSEWDGGCEGGRSLEPETCPASMLGALREAVRPLVTPPWSLRVAEAWRRERQPFDEFKKMLEKEDMLSRGNALVGPLLRGCADAGVTLVAEEGAERLLVEDGRIAGVVAFSGLHHRGASVLLACGGFEWSEELKRQFLPGPLVTSCSVPHNVGDGIRMGAQVGAQLGSMQEAWWQTLVQVPGRECDGVPIGTGIASERALPGSIIVNRRGYRFVNEAMNYNDMTKAFHHFDPRTCSYANSPAFFVFDSVYMERYGFQGVHADETAPEWLTVGASLEELGAALGVDGPTLTETVRRFNEHAAVGRDPEFHRGETPYERYQGDGLSAHAALGPLTTPPFYGVEVVSGSIGTKGGLVTGLDGAVLDAFGEPIAGLYAAGNTTAHPAGPGYPGAGGTLGPGMTMAFVAAEAAVARALTPST